MLKLGHLDETSVTTFRPFPDAPYLVGARCAIQSEHFPKDPGEGLGLIRGDSFGLNEKEVRRAALGELVEHLGSFVGAYEKTLPLRSLHEMRSTGEDFIHPTEFQHFAKDFAEDQLRSRIRPDQPLSWFQVESLTTGEKCWAPALVCFSNFQRAKEEGLFMRPGATGLCAHTSRPRALIHGLLEVVERDHLMMSWRVPGFPVTPIAPGFVPEAYRRAAEAMDLEVRLFKLGSMKMAHTVLGIVSRRDGAKLTCGFSCKLGMAQAIGKALSEAFMGRQSGFTETPGIPQTSREHMAYGYTHGRDVLDWYEKQCQRRKAATNPPSTNILEEVCQTLHSDVYVADLTPDMAAADGWHIIRVLCPGALPRSSHGRYPHLGGPRLSRALSERGLSSKQLNHQHHPFG